MCTVGMSVYLKQDAFVNAIQLIVLGLHLLVPNNYPGHTCRPHQEGLPWCKNVENHAVRVGSPRGELCWLDCRGSTASISGHDSIWKYPNRPHVLN